MKTTSKILVLGYFGYQTNQLDGQTVKTRDIYKLISEHYASVDFYDTQEFQTKRLSIFKMFWKVAKSAQVVYLPAHNNLKYIFPFVWLISRCFRTKIHYFVIGGWLSLFIKRLPLHRFLLKRIDGIYSETERLRHELQDWYGINNVRVFHNFRFFDFQPVVHHETGKLHLVFMARICRPKGLDMIFSLGDYIERSNFSNQITIDFYGPIAQEDKSYFFDEISRFSFMHYKGILQPEQIHGTLQQYDALLLPTHYPREGLPGSIIDAYISGLPVIVTRWAYATEFVVDGVSGYIIPYEGGQMELNHVVISLLKDEKKLLQMKTNAGQYSFRFSEKVAWEKMQMILARGCAGIGFAQ